MTERLSLTQRMRLATLESKGAFEEAARFCEELAAKHPRNAKALARAGYCWLKADKHEKAEKFLEQAVEIDNDDSAAWSNLGHAYGRCGKPHEATMAFRRAQGLDPKSLEPITGEADVCFEERAFDRAVQLSCKATELQPGNHLLWHNLGAAALESRDLETACTALRRAVSLAPQEQAYKATLQKAEAFSQQIDRARQSGMKVRLRGSDGRFRDV